MSNSTAGKSAKAIWEQHSLSSTFSRACREEKEKVDAHTHTIAPTCLHFTVESAALESGCRSHHGTGRGI